MQRDPATGIEFLERYGSGPVVVFLHGIGGNRQQWRDQLLEGTTGVFGEAPKSDPETTIDVETLHAKIGELTLENDFLEGALTKAGLRGERK